MEQALYSFIQIFVVKKNPSFEYLSQFVSFCVVFVLVPVSLMFYVISDQSKPAQTQQKVPSFKRFWSFFPVRPQRRHMVSVSSLRLNRLHLPTVSVRRNQDFLFINNARMCAITFQCLLPVSDGTLPEATADQTHVTDSIKLLFN